MAVNINCLKYLKINEYLLGFGSVKGVDLLIQSFLKEIHLAQERERTERDFKNAQLHLTEGDHGKF